jgi:arylsulfatase A-like enzyme
MAAKYGGALPAAVKNLGLLFRSVLMSNLTRKDFLQSAAGFAFAASACENSPQVPRSQKRPNVLFIMTDEWRAHAFSHMGDANARTPAIDKFKKEAISFKQAIAGTPVCCPARASWITGQYSLTHGVYINDVPLKPKTATFGEKFKEAGYKTGYIGKWHLYGSPQGRHERRLDYIPPERRFGFDYWKACECTHDYNNSLYYEGNNPAPKYWDGYDAIAQTDDAIRFIGGHAGGADPYCLVLSWGPPHFPYAAPEEYLRLYRGKKLTLRPNVPDEAQEKAVTELKGYYAAIAALDDCFARLMAAVEANGADDTIVVFTSDHGEMAYSQGLNYKLYPWEESIRIPFMVRYPRAFARREVATDAPLNSPDIMPTVLGIAGIPIPLGLDGTDYSPLLRGEGNQKFPDTAFLSLPVPITTARTYGFDAYRGVRDRRYTYARSLKGPWLLYDNERDPYQKENLISRPEMNEIQAHLERALNDWLERLGDKFLHSQEYLKRDGLEHYVEAMWPIGRKESHWGDWGPTLEVPPSQPRSIDASIAQLYGDPVSAEALDAVDPSLRRLKDIGIVATASPRALSMLPPHRISPGELAEIERRLGQLPRPDND